MSGIPATESSGGSGERILGLIGALAALTIVVHVVIVGMLPSPASYKELSTYEANQRLYTALLVTAMLIAVLTIPFVGGVSRLVAKRSDALATA